MKIFIAILLLVGSVAAHFVAVAYGIYDVQLREGVVWFDNILHALVGVAFAFIWISFLERVRPESNWLFIAVTTMTFVAVMAALWELFELAFYLVFKSGALGLKVYSPSIQEAVVDSISNIAGAAALLCGRAIGR